MDNGAGNVFTTVVKTLLCGPPLFLHFALPHAGEPAMQVKTEEELQEAIQASQTEHSDKCVQPLCCAAC